MTFKPYFSDDTVALYLGDMREVLPALGITADLIVADPPYGQTELVWDRWPDGWLDVAATVTSSLWCFGSLRMYLDRRDEFAGWKLSQDVIWRKHNGSGFHNDRFRRVHEQPTHWYRDDWSRIYHQVPVTMDATKRAVRTKNRPTPMGHRSKSGAAYVSEDGGPRLALSVIEVRSMHHKAIHPTEKPIGILAPLIEYACPPGGLVVDPFAGSGSTLDAARQCGRRAIGIEVDEKYADRAARRLQQLTLEI